MNSIMGVRHQWSPGPAAFFDRTGHLHPVARGIFWLSASQLRPDFMRDRRALHALDDVALDGHA